MTEPEPTAPDATAAPASTSMPVRAPRPAAPLRARDVFPGLRRAFVFLVPLPHDRRLGRMTEFGLGAAFFPLISLVIGALLAGVAWAAAKLWGPWVVCALVWALAAAIDWIDFEGLCDFVDAFVLRHEREEILRILKDPNAGAAGVLAIVVVAVAQLVCLVNVPAERLFVTLCGVQLVSRWASLVVIYRAPPVHAKSTMRLFIDNLRPSFFFFSTLYVAAGAVLLMGPARGGACLLATLLVGLAVRRTSIARLGAVQGDGLRAAKALAMLVCLLVAAAAYRA